MAHRIAWSKRLFKLLAFAILVATTCVALGIWQIARLHQRQQFNAKVRAALAMAPQPVQTLLPEGVDPDSVRYLQARATGRYDVAHEVVLFGRTQNGQAGNHLLTPLITPEGTAVIVDRGWVPFDVNTPGAAETAPPATTVTVVGILYRSEGGLPNEAASSQAPGTTIGQIDLARLQAQLPYAIAPVYLQLQTQSPAQTGAFPQPAPLPELSDGPHLGYAIQWFTFATIALGGFVVLALREGREPPTPEDGSEHA